MAEWDDQDFEPRSLTAKQGVNKWDGEDEDDDVKDNWEDEEEEKQAEPEPVEAVPKLKKKSLAERIAEKERLKQEEHERRAKEQQEEEISAEEQLQRQKESDLKAALETTFGGTANDNVAVLDTMLPVTKEEFQEFESALLKKIQAVSKSEEYPELAENLVRNICASLNSFDVKKIKNTIDNLYLEKQKIEKGDKAKKAKSKTKAKLRIEGNNDVNQYSAYVDDFDYDDFM